MKPEALAKSVVRGVVYSQLAYWSSLACAALSVIYLPRGSIQSFVILTPLLMNLAIQAQALAKNTWRLWRAAGAEAISVMSSSDSASLHAATPNGESGA